MGEARASRRSFLARLFRATLLAGAAGLASAIVAYLLAPSDLRTAFGRRRVRVGRGDDIPLGEGRLALVNEAPVWVVHLAQGFVAISALCTHKGCIIGWEDRRRVFRCPCHEGLFDERGNVVAGLPRRPLTRLRVALVGADLYVSPEEEPSL